MVKKMKWPGINPDIYYIFDDGRIWSKVKKDFLSFKIDKDGYYVIGLHIKGVGKRNIPIHKLMEYNYMDMSLKKNFKDPTVDHIDSNRKNNKISNLRYLERADNTRRGKHYKNHYNHSKLTPEDVHIICKLFTYNWTVKEIQATGLFNISNATLYQIKLKHAWAWIGDLYF